MRKPDYISGPTNNMSANFELIRVKFLTKSPQADVSATWQRCFPRQEPVWDRCRFIFHRDCRKYDWLVVYDDLPPKAGERHTLWAEELPGRRENSLFMTVEPSAIKVYGTRFLAQFGWVLTSQEPWALRHPGVIRSQVGLVPFYQGSYDEMVAHPPTNKTALIATVCSAKQQSHTLHQDRYAFTQRLQRALPELEIFGHGVRPMERKNEALDAFRYHVAIENHVCQHHWTEKLADAFLGLCLPFYHGAPNAADYFPAESFIPINIHNFEASLARIKHAVRDNEYERRLPALHEARRLVLERHGTFPQLARLIQERHQPSGGSVPAQPHVILSRHLWRRRHPLAALMYGGERLRVAWRHELRRRFHRT